MFSWWFMFTFSSNFMLSDVGYYGAPPHPLSSSVPQHFLLSWSWNNIKNFHYLSCDLFCLRTWDCARVMSSAVLWRWQCHLSWLGHIWIRCYKLQGRGGLFTCTSPPSHQSPPQWVSSGQSSIEDSMNFMSKYIWSNHVWQEELRHINVLHFTNHLLRTCSRTFQLTINYKPAVLTCGRLIQNILALNRQ